MSTETVERDDAYGDKGFLIIGDSDTMELSKNAIGQILYRDYIIQLTAYVELGKSMQAIHLIDDSDHVITHQEFNSVEEAIIFINSNKTH